MQIKQVLSLKVLMELVKVAMSSMGTMGCYSIYVELL